MIEIQNVFKNYEGKQILKDISISIKEGEVFGLIGTNGAGKSTLLRMMSGIITPDSGTITIDNIPVTDAEKARKHIFFIPDELYFFFAATPIRMMKYYKSVYPEFDDKKFLKLLEAFSFHPKGKMETMSKGMRKQIAIFSGLCANTKYLYCDETFDGLDPVMRQNIKSLLVREMQDRGLTPIIASHNLREQEDICDHVGVIHNSELVLSKDILELKCFTRKIECAFVNEKEAENCLKQLDIVKQSQKGPLYLLTVNGEQDEIMQIFSSASTTYLDMKPLTLEEIFITEMEAVGYDIKTLILD